jgi:hypothetical protein
VYDLGECDALGRSPSWRAVDAKVLRSYAFDNVRKVQKFDEIAKLADERGLDVFVLGGGAGCFLHQLRLRALSDAGVPGLRKGVVDSNELDRFLFDGQDLDIVITRKDGTKESEQDILEFDKVVKTVVKRETEVRGLKRGTSGKHEALLGPSAAEFLWGNHHNTVDYLMLHLNADEAEHVVRDLHDWESDLPKALRESAAGEIHFEYSPSHTSSQLAKLGTNPEIKQVLRLVIKASRHDLVVPESSREKLREIVSETNLEGEFKSSRFEQWLKENVPKLIQSADINRAWELLEDLGLREKLARRKGPEFLPFRRKVLPELSGVSSNDGARADELGIDIINHTTASEESWTAIAGTPYVHPNIFLRDPTNVALYGQGLYTVQGTEAVYQSGPSFSIQLRLAPDAIHGIDFIVVEHPKIPHRVWEGPPWVIVRNRSKVTLVDSGERPSLTTPQLIGELLNPSRLMHPHIRAQHLAQLEECQLSDEDRQVYLQLADELLSREPTTRPTVRQLLELLAGPNGERKELYDGALVRLFQSAPELSERLLKAIDPADPLRTDYALDLIKRWVPSEHAAKLMHAAADLLGDYIWGLIATKGAFDRDVDGALSGVIDYLLDQKPDFNIRSSLLWNVFSSHPVRYARQLRRALDETPFQSDRRYLDTLNWLANTLSRKLEGEDAELVAELYAAVQKKIEELQGR